MIRSAVYLAARSLWWYRGRAATVILCLALTLWLPVTVRLLLNQFRHDIVARADSTPLVIGTKGSRIDLALKALYFDTVAPDQATMEETLFVQDSGHATAIPVHVSYRTQSVNDSDGVPIVGTTLEYFEFRGLSVAAGAGLGMLGDCVLGSNAANRLRLKPGDRILSAPKNAFNLAGDYPLRMNITGILAPSHSPDDDVVFVDIRTAWIIDGIGHGHQKVDQETHEDLLLGQTENTVTASAAVLPFTEITPDNIDSFHFHGEEHTFPITAVIADPHSRKDQTLLLGEYLSERNQTAQCVKPGDVVQDLLQIVFRVERLVWLSSVLSGLATAMLLALVLFLSIRLRAQEIQTMFKIGCSRSTISLIIGTEILLMILAGTALAMIGARICQQLAADSLKLLLF